MPLFSYAYEVSCRIRVEDTLLNKKFKIKDKDKLQTLNIYLTSHLNLSLDSPQKWFPRSL